MTYQIRYRKGDRINRVSLTPVQRSATWLKPCYVDHVNGKVGDSVVSVTLRENTTFEMLSTTQHHYSILTYCLWNGHRVILEEYEAVNEGCYIGESPHNEPMIVL
jgi:hypothetical protein